MPTNGFSIKPLKVNRLAGEQKATEKRGLRSGHGREALANASMPCPRFSIDSQNGSQDEAAIMQMNKPLSRKDATGRIQEKQEIRLGNVTAEVEILNGLDGHQNSCLEAMVPPSWIPCQT